VVSNRRTGPSGCAGSRTTDVAGATRKWVNEITAHAQQTPRCRLAPPHLPFHPSTLLLFPLRLPGGFFLDARPCTVYTERIWISHREAVNKTMVPRTLHIVNDSPLVAAGQGESMGIEGVLGGANMPNKPNLALGRSERGGSMSQPSASSRFPLPPDGEGTTGAPAARARTPLCQTKPISRDGGNAPQRHGVHRDGCKCNWKRELGIMLSGLRVSVVNNRVGETSVRNSGPKHAKQSQFPGRAVGGHGPPYRMVGRRLCRRGKGPGNHKQTQFSRFWGLEWGLR